jgi:hypothetical protein
MEYRTEMDVEVWSEFSWFRIGFSDVNCTEASETLSHQLLRENSVVCRRNIWVYNDICMYVVSIITYK